MNDLDLHEIGYGGVNVTEKDGQGTILGDSATLPSNWASFQESLWETLTFQPNVNRTYSSDALGLSLAMQCGDVKARDIAKSEMVLWRKKGREWIEVEPRQHWFARMLARQPNEFHTWSEFWRMVVIHLEMSQNAYILKVINRQGDVLELIPIPSGRCRPRVGNNGGMFYEIKADTEFNRARIGGYEVVVPADRMIHLRGRMYDGAMGVSNIRMGEPLFDLMGAISKFQTELFGSDGRQSLVFESASDTAGFGPGDQADAAFQRLKKQLTERWRKGEPILLEAGYKAKVVSQSARDAMTTEAFNSVVSRICTLMHTPPHKIFALESVKYDNAAAADNLYANDCLIPIAKNIEEKFRQALFTEDEWDILWPEFDRMPMIAGDPKTMIEVIDRATKLGLMTVNEGRERLPLSLNPIKGGDVRMVPVAYAMVDSDGNVAQQAATGQIGNDGVTEFPAEPDPAKSLRLVADNT